MDSFLILIFNHNPISHAISHCLTFSNLCYLKINFIIINIIIIFSLKGEDKSLTLPQSIILKNNFKKMLSRTRTDPNYWHFSMKKDAIHVPKEYDLFQNDPR